MDLTLLTKIVKMEAHIRKTQVSLDAVGIMVDKRSIQIPNLLIFASDMP